MIAFELSRLYMSSIAFKFDIYKEMLRDKRTSKSVLL